MKLSEHFALAEFTRSDVASRLGIDNDPPASVIASLRVLCEGLLEPIRAHFKKPLKISSGYRSLELNKVIGGNPLGSHPLGEAADFEIPGVDNLIIARWIEASALPYDQLILEFYTPGVPFSGWAHVSHRPMRPNRRSVLTALRRNGRTCYDKGLPK